MSDPKRVTSSQLSNRLPLHSETGRLLLSTDWSESSLGPADEWSEQLLSFLSVVFYAKVPMAILWGTELTFIYNDAFVPLLGQQHPRAMGSSVLQSFSLNWPLMKSMLTTTVKNKEERYLSNINIEGRFYNLCASPCIKKGAKVQGLLLQAIETGRHGEKKEPNTIDEKTRKEIEDLQNRQKLAIEAANIGTYEWNLGINKFKYSQRLAKLYGFTDEKNLKQVDFAARVHPDDKKLREKANEQALKTGVLNYEVRVVHPDKSVHWVRVNGRVTYSDDKKPEKLYGTALDITDQKNISEELQRQVEERTQSLRKMNEDLKRSEERYHKMTEEVQDYAILLLDTQGNILNWNLGAQRIKGYSEKEIIGKNFRNFYTPEDKERNLPESLLQTAKETGKATQEGWRMRKDGTRFWASVVITALHDSKHNIIGYSKVTRDLTERKIAEDQTKQYLAELQVQNRELEQFAYVASHDLQEPLRKIRTFLDLVKNNLNNAQVVSRYFEKIDSSALRMTELIRSILNYSRLSTLKEEHTDVDLGVILKGVLADLELLIQEKGAVIETGKLPTVIGSKTQMQQLFLNLISNSIKFSTNQPKISITATRVDVTEVPGREKLIDRTMYHKLVFRDNGIGFDQKYAEQVFTIFQRLHTRETYAGTGIGLALCRRIVDNHHGVITVKSELDKGTEFFVYLPAK